MGVQKFRKVLRELIPSYSFDETIPKGSLLLIDMTGFFFHMMSLVGDDRLLRDSILLDGYKHVDEIVHRTLAHWIDNLQFKLHFFIAGETKESYYRGDITEDKRSSLQGNWDNIEALLSSLTATQFADSNIKRCNEKQLEQLGYGVKPPLLNEQCVLSVREFARLRGINITSATSRVHIVHCVGSANIEIGVAAHKYAPLSNRMGIFVYSADTDFAFMRDCRLILFENSQALQVDNKKSNNTSPLINSVFRATNPITFASMTSSTSSTSTEVAIRVPVYSLSKLSAALQLSESAVQSFALLLGTEHTQRFNRDDFKLSTMPMKKIPLGFSAKMLNVLVTLLRSAGSSCTLTTSKSEQGECMRYSLMLFNDAKHITTMHKREALTKMRVGDVCGDQCVYSLSTFQKDQLSIFVSEFESAGETDFHMLLRNLLNAHVSDRLTLFPVLRQRDVNSLLAMLDELALRPTSTSTSTSASASTRAPPSGSTVGASTAPTSIARSTTSTSAVSAPTNTRSTNNSAAVSTNLSRMTVQYLHVFSVYQMIVHRCLRQLRLSRGLKLFESLRESLTHTEPSECFDGELLLSLLIRS